jgi:hypothetical protein
MKVNVFFDGKLWNADILDADIIEIPDCLKDSLDKIRQSYFDWLYDKNNDHKYWMYVNGEKRCVESDSETFIEWMNEHLLNDKPQKARMVERNAAKVDPGLPYLLF